MQEIHWCVSIQSKVSHCSGLYEDFPWWKWVQKQTLWKHHIQTSWCHSAGAPCWKVSGLRQHQPVSIWVKSKTLWAYQFVYFLTIFSLDFIFSNWLLMYLDEPEVIELFRKMLMWLRPGGKLFFRESCFHQSGWCLCVSSFELITQICLLITLIWKSVFLHHVIKGDKSRRTNPTKYRDPGAYNSLSQAPSLKLANGKGYHVFELIFSKSIQTYVKVRHTHWIKLTATEFHQFGLKFSRWKITPTKSAGTFRK